MKKMFTPVAYKKKTILNRLTTVMEELIRQARTMELSPRTTPQLKKMRKANAMSIFNIPLLYQRNGIFFWKNYMGELFMTADDVDVIPHVAKMGDTVVFMHLVRVQLELALCEYQSGDPSQVLMRLGPETFNPCTSAPFSWDADKQVLWFEKAGTGETPAQVRLPSSKTSREETP